MTQDPIKNVIVNTGDAKSVFEATKNIRKVLEEEKVKFDIESLWLLNKLLEKTEKAANLKMK